LEQLLFKLLKMGVPMEMAVRNAVRGPMPILDPILQEKVHFDSCMSASEHALLTHPLHQFDLAALTYHVKAA
jgi:hypothetical protein